MIEKILFKFCLRFSLKLKVRNSGLFKFLKSQNFVIKQTLRKLIFLKLPKFQGSLLLQTNWPDKGIETLINVCFIFCFINYKPIDLIKGLRPKNKLPINVYFNNYKPIDPIRGLRPKLREV